MNTVSNRIIQAIIRRSHLEFVFEIGNGAQAFHDELAVDFLGEMHEQVVKAHNRDVVQVGRGFLRERDALFEREQGRFLSLFATPTITSSNI